MADWQRRRAGQRQRSVMDTSAAETVPHRSANGVDAPSIVALAAAAAAAER